MVTCPTCRAENQDGARFCHNCGSPLGAPRPVEGERKFATVLFADVVRSTAMAEKLDPEDLAAIMNGAFAFMNAAVTRYGGTVSRLMGDAVLALFGAPVAHEDDAERAVRAGLEIQQGAAAYSRTVRARYGVDFSLRVGINTGTSVLATVGDAVKAEYTAMGDTANVAARLQSAARPGSVLVSAATHRLVRAQFDFAEGVSLEVKGKSAAVETFEVLAPMAVPGKLRGLEGLSSPLVGRDPELELLRAKLVALSSGRGAVVAVLGEAGLGKSRLVAELRTASSETPGGVTWLEGRAISYGQSYPYYPWQQVGRQIVGAPPGEGAAALRTRLQQLAAERGLPPSDLPFLETMIGVDSEESRAALAKLNGDGLVYGVANAVVGCVHAFLHAGGGSHPHGGGSHPHVLVFDDLHWADSPSLELIAQVATLAVADPLLLICVLRPDRKAPSWALLERLRASVGAAYHQIDLEPLPPSQARELLGNLLHVEDLPSDIRALILQRSDGNPFYLEEVLRSLIDAGHIVNEGGHWRATRDITNATIPETLAGVLAARIDRLPEHTKRVAQTAAVLGRIFAYRALTKVCKDAPPTERIEHVDPHLGVLSYEDLVRERARDPEREFIFKHALTCEAAYELLLRSRRRELHGRVGCALEEIHRSNTDDVAAILAHHFGEAGDLVRTSRYSMRAAESALKLFALKEALALYERACVALEAMENPPPEDLYDAILGWTLARHKADQYQGVIERLERGVAIARSLEDKRRLARALTWIANVYMLMGRPSRSVPYLLEAQQHATDVGDERVFLLPLFFASESLVDRDPRAAVEQFEHIAEISRANGVRELEGHALAARALALARLGEFAAAEEGVRQALEAARHGGSVVKEADVHIIVGVAYREMGDMAKSVEHARKGAELAESVNAIDCACSGYMELGLTQLARRELEEALDLLNQSLEFADQSLSAGTGMEGFVNRIHGGVAATKLELSDPNALPALERTLQNALSDRDEYSIAGISENIARAHLDRDRASDAEPYLRAPIDYYRRANMKAYLMRALRLQATVQERLGRPDAAESVRAEVALLEESLRANRQSTIPAGEQSDSRSASGASVPTS